MICTTYFMYNNYKIVFVIIYTQRNFVLDLHNLQLL